MKVYNAQILVDKDEFKIMFECDKEKNKKCSGYRNCGECNYTTDSRYAKAVDEQNDTKDVLIKDLQDTLFQVLFTGKSIEEICKNKTSNQIRRLFGLEEIRRQ